MPCFLLLNNWGSCALFLLFCWVFKLLQVTAATLHVLSLHFLHLFFTNKTEVAIQNIGIFPCDSWGQGRSWDGQWLHEIYTCNLQKYQVMRWKIYTYWFFQSNLWNIVLRLIPDSTTLHVCSTYNVRVRLWNEFGAMTDSDSTLLLNRSAQFSPCYWRFCMSFFINSLLYIFYTTFIMSCYKKTVVKWVICAARSAHGKYRAYTSCHPIFTLHNT